MTTLLIITAIIAVSLIMAGWAASRKPVQAGPEFARCTNGRDVDDALKAHRSK